jgi:hypothetical protein
MESSAGSVTAHTESSIVAERSGNSFISVLGTLNSGVLFGDAGGNETGRIIYNFGSDYMKFNIANTERMRILSGGGITFNGDTAAANALDDYEEGTWTPAYTPISGSFGAMTYTSGGGIGRYIKVGNLVTLMCQMGTDSVTVNTASGALRVGGLPFTPGNISAGNWGQGITSQNWGGDNPMGVQIRNNETELDMYYRTAANGSMTLLNVTDMDTGGDSNYTRFTLAYITGGS